MLSLQITLQPALGPGGCGHQRAPGALASGWARPWGAPAAAQREGGEPGAARTLGRVPLLFRDPLTALATLSGYHCLHSPSDLRGDSPYCPQPREPPLPVQVSLTTSMAV